MSTDPRGAWLTVRSTISAFHSGTQNLDVIPQLLRVLLEDESWRCFVMPTGEVVTCERFADFIARPSPRGLGTTVENVRRLLGEDVKARDLLDQALQQPRGGAHPKVDIINSAQAVTQPDGTSEAAALRRLRKDNPDLHADVLAGRLSAHAAMVKAGHRPRTLSVPVDRPDRVAAALRRHMSAQALAELGGLLRPCACPCHGDKERR